MGLGDAGGLEEDNGSGCGERFQIYWAGLCD